MDLEKSSLAQHLSSSKYIVALIGAGMSAPSGIPTYRDASSSSGLDTAWYATRAASQEHPEAVWQYYNALRRTVYHASPNPAHYALARLARLDDNFLAITQNVDGDSQRAGHSRQLAELHGSLSTTKMLQRYMRPHHITR
ncbi:uncharacterized protein RCC_08067 [Ramularia collo-cygni]|uniref:Deacetylase sirtuin-type domain-containing protein n=1 Tax=Ramularia collo-cygni TaxID=112498 RepID=A0A2D3V302_9PEZI|nr:uncharacterized protein RCC_08067 [Ramularia collo-cygni]CZT22198.1 uncharacterized protein RCC_08067 [Ramularia collo-cygni]